MTAPYVAYEATAGQEDFVVPFPFITRDHVKVKVNGVLRTTDPWPSAGVLRLSEARFAGDFVEIYRATPLDGPLVAFQNGAVLTAEDLNTAVLQLLYRLQEMSNLYERTVGSASTRLAELGGVPVNSADIFDTLAVQLLERQLFSELLDRIAVIEAGGGEALLQQEIADRIAAINAVYSQISTDVAAVEARVGGRVDAVEVRVGGRVDALIGDTNTKFAGVDTRIAAVEDTNTTQASQLTTVIAKADGNAAAIVTEQTARVNADGALSTRIDAVVAKADGNAAAILSEQTARVNADGALSTRIDAVVAKADGNAASILSEQTARANADGALSTRIDAVVAKADGNAAAILSEQTARANADGALSTRIDVLTAKATANEATIAAEATARANADEAFAQTLSLIGAKNANGTAFVIDTGKAQITGGTTLASKFSALQSSIDGANSAITSEATARSSADSALSTRIDTAQATANNAAAAVTNETNARVAQGEAFTSQLATLTTSVNGNVAAIATESAARSTADSALAGQINVLTTTVNGNTASITTMQGSINGVLLEYGIKLNSNGHITGFRQFNNGNEGGFIVQADIFQIVAPNGGTPVIPFTVTAEGVRINGNLIVNGSIINDQFNMNTMVKRGVASWSGSVTPGPGGITFVLDEPLGDIGKDGSVRLDYDLRFSATVGTSTGTFAGLPLYTSTLADGFVVVRVISGYTVVAQAAFNAYEFSQGALGTYSVTKVAQLVVDRVGAPLSNCRIQAYVQRGDTDTGVINEGDYYTRQVSGSYTLGLAWASAKWTFI